MPWYLWVGVGVPRCVGVCVDVPGCTWVYAGVRGYTQVYADVHGYAQLYLGVGGCVRKCDCLCRMNFQNTYWRLESIHQRTLIRILYEFLSQCSKIKRLICLGNFFGCLSFLHAYLICILFILVLDGCWIDELMHQQWFIMRPHFFAHIEYYLVLQVFSSCHWHTNECKPIFGVWTILFRRTVAWWAKSFLIRRLIKDYRHEWTRIISIKNRSVPWLVTGRVAPFSTYANSSHVELLYANAQAIFR